MRCRGQSNVSGKGCTIGACWKKAALRCPPKLLQTKSKTTFFLHPKNLIEQFCLKKGAFGWGVTSAGNNSCGKNDVPNFGTLFSGFF
jgi:hypothetical protein